MMSDFFKNCPFLIGFVVLTMMAPWSSAGVQKSASGLIVVEHAGRFGVIDENGIVVVPFLYGRIEGFDTSGRAVVPLASNGKLGCVDTAGMTIVPHVWDRLRVLDNNTIWGSADETWIYDKNGIVLAKYPFACESPWNANGLAPQKRSSGYVLVDREGRTRSRTWDSLEGFARDGRYHSKGNGAAISEGDGRFIAGEWHADVSRTHYFVLDTNGEPIQMNVAKPILGIYPARFPAGWMMINAASKFGYVDGAYKVRIPFVWDKLGWFTQFDSGAAPICSASADGQGVLLNLNGERVLQSQSERYYMDFTKEGFARFGNGRGEVGWIKCDGSSDTCVTADSVYDFSGLRVAGFKRNGKFGCINDNSTIVLSPIYDYLDWSDVQGKRLIYAILDSECFAFSPQGVIQWKLHLPGKFATLNVQKTGVVFSIRRPPRVQSKSYSYLVTNSGPLGNSVSNFLYPMTLPTTQTIVVNHAGEILWSSPRHFTWIEMLLMAVGGTALFWFGQRKLRRLLTITSASRCSKTGTP